MINPVQSVRRRDGVVWALALALAACQQPQAPESGEAEAEPVQGQTPAPMNDAKATTSLPAAALAAWEQYARGECRAMGETFSEVRLVPAGSIGPGSNLTARHGTFVTADFNNDGATDFIVTTDNWGCSGPSDNGKMGPPNDTIISTPKGFLASYAFNNWIDENSIERRSKGDVIILRGPWNGSCGPVDKVVWGLTDKGMEAIEHRDDKGRLVDQEGCPVTGKGALPVKTGLWADDRAGGCAAMKANDPAFILTKDRMLFPQDYKDMKPVKELGGGRFQTGSQSNFDQQILNVQSPTRMKIEGEFGGSYTWCSAATRWQPWEYDPAADE